MEFDGLVIEIRDNNQDESDLRSRFETSVSRRIRRSNTTRKTYRRDFPTSSEPAITRVSQCQLTPHASSIIDPKRLRMQIL